MERKKLVSMFLTVSKLLKNGYGAIIVFLVSKINQELKSLTFNITPIPLI